MSSLQDHLKSESAFQCAEEISYQHQYGTIKTPKDLLAIPGYEANVDFDKDSGRRLSEMLDHYTFTKADEYPCGIKQCNTIHQHGYLVRTSDGTLTNIGKDCGKKYLELDFDRVRKTYREKRKAADNLSSIREIRAKLSPLEDRLRSLMDLGANLGKCKETLREWLPDQLNRVMAMGREGGSDIIVTRRISKREADIHYAKTGTSRKNYPEGRPTIDEVVGRIAGCQFFRDSLGLLIKKQILPPLDELRAIDDERLRSMSFRDLENLSRNINNAIRLIHRAEEISGYGLQFFDGDNLQRLTLMGASPENLDRVIKACEGLQDFRGKALE